jgi:pimeloyl-ACP methyl ester carboxylesterase
MLHALKRVLYLHGFASSPYSRKGVFLAARLRESGFTVEIPALDAGDFRNLTVTKQLSLIHHSAASGPLAVVGSSLGGYLAALLAAREPNVRRVVLLAPAFDFHRLWVDELGPARLAEWEQSDALQVFHYGEGRQVPLSYSLMKDAATYEAFPRFEQPGLIFHGENDTVVPISLSEHYVQAHPNCRLVRLQSGHELTDVLEDIWPVAESFLADEGR